MYEFLRGYCYAKRYVAAHVPWKKAGLAKLWPNWAELEAIRLLKEPKEWKRARFRRRDTCACSIVLCVNSLILCVFCQGMESCDSAGAENTLLLVADVLATLAVTDTGQRQLLYGETQDRWQRSRYCRVSTIRGKES